MMPLKFVDWHTPMLLFSLLSVGLFCAAFLIGWLTYRSFVWNWIDLVYYPLAAIGVSLLFLSNDVQRELLDVAELIERKNSVLVDLRNNRPNVEIDNAEQLLAGSLEHIAVIQKWTEICDPGPASVKPRCLAVKDLGPLVQRFLKTAREARGSYEANLASVCIAGDSLLKNIQQKNALSDLVMDRFLAQFEKLSSLKLSPLAFDAFSSEVDEFKRSTQEHVNRIHRAAFDEEDNSGRLLRDVQRAEIEYAAILLMGLSQCASEARTGADVLRQWAEKTSTQEQEVARLEARRQDLKQATTSRRALLWIQLNLWPLVLLGALSLKFAKGAAALRKTKSG